jgi:cysteine desulfuration protein SufE
MPAALREVLDDLALFPDRADRIEALIDIGSDYQNFSAEQVPRDERLRVPGCESEVFFLAIDRPGGGKEYRFAVDNPQGISAMALAAILQRASGSSREDIAAIPEDLVYRIFGNELSMGKSLGLNNMLRVLKLA